MTPERWVQIEELFHRAAECAPEDRTVLLDEACRDDLELRREVDALLFSDGIAGGSMQAAVRSELDAVGFPLSGETVSHYRILNGLGAGGMGSVYQAEDIKLGRRVALKFLPEESAKDSLALGRFEREARSASALEHPSICPIYEFGEHEGQPFLVMQLLEGQTLRELISAAGPGKPPLELNKLLELAIQITEGLEAAHRLGIIHRDIKPANIFVTSQARAKILDFGLAKLASDVAAESDHSQKALRDRSEVIPHEHAPASTPDLFLSGTGVAMGTAGYMSPEQVRGEILDARTDLFSFGLVLYEMATGQRAFKGDTGPVQQDAVLKQTPSPARSINPQVPAKLDEIINRALAKTREARYQTACEIRADLESLKKRIEPRHPVRAWALASAGFVALLAVSTIVWLTNYQPSSPPATPDLKLRQLTTNSPENGVISGAISPDGKYLAYSDIKGMHIKTLQSGEIKSVPQPVEFDGKEMNWEVAPAWLPDGITFVANAHLGGGDYGNWTSQGSSIWLGSVLGGPPRKLRQEARAYAISPDGALVSFATHGPSNAPSLKTEIWQMGVDGGHAKLLFNSNAQDTIDWVAWSQDQQRFIYVEIDQAGNASLVSSDVNGGPVTTLLPPTVFQRVDEMLWLPDGRLLYELPEPESQSASDNYWVVRLDLRTGEQVEKPRRVTNWTGFALSSSSVTADGKRLAFRQWTSHTTVQLADFETTGKRIISSRHFTLSETSDYVYDWTPDSRTMIFGSYRDGYHRIYRQALTDDTPTPVVDGEIDFRAARVSPDGKWIVGLVWPSSDTQARELKLARVSINGGKPELVFSVHANPWSMIFCARPPSDLCAIANPTEDRKQLVVTAFDPVRGKGRELVRFDLDPNVIHWFCEISPDGTRLAAIRGPEGPIQILSLRGRPARVIHAKDLKNLQSLTWAADGSGLFVSKRTLAGMEILYVDLQGNEKVLWKNDRGNQDNENRARQSPDGKHLAIQDPDVTSNMWMMENF